MTAAQPGLLLDELADDAQLDFHARLAFAPDDLAAAFASLSLQQLCGTDVTAERYDFAIALADTPLTLARFADAAPAPCELDAAATLDAIREHVHALHPDLPDFDDLAQANITADELAASVAAVATLFAEIAAQPPHIAARLVRMGAIFSYARLLDGLDDLDPGGDPPPSPSHDA